MRSETLRQLASFILQMCFGLIVWSAAFTCVRVRSHLLALCCRALAQSLGIISKLATSNFIGSFSTSEVRF